MKKFIFALTVSAFGASVANPTPYIYYQQPPESNGLLHDAANSIRWTCQTAKNLALTSIAVGTVYVVWKYGLPYILNSYATKSDLTDAKERIIENIGQSEGKLSGSIEQSKKELHVQINELKELNEKSKTQLTEFINKAVTKGELKKLYETIEDLKKGLMTKEQVKNLLGENNKQLQQTIKDDVDQSLKQNQDLIRKELQQAAEYSDRKTEEAARKFDEKTDDLLKSMTKAVQKTVKETLQAELIDMQALCDGKKNQSPGPLVSALSRSQRQKGSNFYVKTPLNY